MTVLKGRHWSFDGQILHIFGMFGTRIGSHTYFGWGPAQMVSTNFDPLKGTIPNSLSSLKSRYCGVEIVKIQLHPIVAFHLYFDQVITTALLEQAQEDEESISIKVVFNDVLREIIIQDHPEKSVTYYDIHGNVYMLP